MKRKLTSIKTIPFQGGCNTVVEPALLDGKPSMVQNFRQKHPGFVKRQGQIKQHPTTLGASAKILSLYQFVKGKKTERHFYAQVSDDDVYEAATAPPSVASTVFGSAVFTGTASSLPASWANVNDLLLFANGVDTPQIYPGTASPVEKFIVYKGTAAIPTIPELGDDYTLEVTDGSTTTVAVLNDLGALAAYDCIFVMTPVPIDGLNFTISAPNGTVSAAGCNYWNGSAWATVGTVGDTTKGTNTTLSVDGAWTWTLPTVHVPSYMYGVCGFWYQLHVSVALDAATSVSAVTYESDWQAMQNVWDGIPVPIVEAQVYDTSGAKYSIYGSSAIDIGGAVGGSDILYIAATDPICGILVDVGTATSVTGTDITSLKYWNGAWTAVTGLSDGTDGLTKTGWITFARQSDVQKYAFNSSVYYAYWYQITLPLVNAAVCLNFDGADAATTFTDLSGKTWSAVGNAQLDTAQQKFGTASLLLDGVGDYITTPAHEDFKFGTGDFTIEWFGRVANLSATYYHVPLSVTKTSGTDYFYCVLTIAITSGVTGLIILNETDNVNTINATITGSAIAAATWYHFAVVRENGIIQLFINGVPQTADAIGTAGSVFYDGVTPYRSGTEGSGVYNGTGWMDDLRITNACLYPVAATFTPPASAVGIGTSGAFGADITLSVDTEPYFDITEFGKGQTVASWKNRTSLGTNMDHYIYLSASGQPQVFNGDDWTILAPGDGRYNRSVAQRKLHDVLIIWQEEKGQEGGCITKYEWVTSVDDIKKTIISTTLGAMNAKSVDIVDGVEFVELNRDVPIMSLAFFLSRTGVYVTDGSTVYMISQDIQNYFDPTQSVCIRVGYEAQHWLKYDSAYGVIRIGLVSGSSASVPNVFPVYDVKDKSWSFDVLEQPLSCMTEAEAGSGNVTVVQLGGGTADGFVYVLNSGTNDVTHEIDSFVTAEIDGKGEILHMSELLLRAKAQTGDITVTPSLNSIAQSALTLSQAAETATQTIRRNRVNTNLTGQHISLKIQHNTASQSCQLLDIGTAMEVYEEQ